MLLTNLPTNAMDQQTEWHIELLHATKNHFLSKIYNNGVCQKVVKSGVLNAWLAIGAIWGVVIMGRIFCCLGPELWVWLLFTRHQWHRFWGHSVFQHKNDFSQWNCFGMENFQNALLHKLSNVYVQRELIIDCWPIDNAHPKTFFFGQKLRGISPCIDGQRSQLWTPAAKDPSNDKYSPSGTYSQSSI